MAKSNHTEEWRPVVGWEDIYSVSNLGRVRKDVASRNSHAGKIILPCPNSNGYCVVTLCDGKRRFSTSPHREVMAAFVGARSNGMTINHLNGIKTDNRLENLEYCTQRENVRHAIQVLGHRVDGSKNGNAKLSDAEVMHIAKSIAAGKTWAWACKKYGISKPTVWRIVTKKSHKSALATGCPEYAKKTPKLTANQVSQIRRRYNAGEQQVKLASEYGVWQATISCIVLRQTWKHVP